MFVAQFFASIFLPSLLSLPLLEKKRTDPCVKLVGYAVTFPRLLDHLKGALHAAVRGGQLGTAHVRYFLPWSQDGLVAHHTCM